MAAIWNDDDFLSMDVSAQRLYMFLLSQPDLSHAGLVPMRIRRWAKKAKGTTPADIDGTLRVLSEERFVVIDHDTEEVLLRTFVRNDGVYKQPKVMLRLREDAKLIESPLLRSAFRAELDRLPLQELADGTRGTVEKIVHDLREDFGDVSAGRYPSERVSDTPGEPIAEATEGVADTPRVRAGAFPQPPTPIPQPPATVPPQAAGGGEPGASLALVDMAPTAQTLVAEWIDHCPERPPGRVIGQIAKELKTMLDEGVSPERVRSGLAEWNRKGLHPSTLASVVHEITNRKPTARSQQATDDLFSAAMERAIERDRTSA
jgi:hypothetical protein